MRILFVAMPDSIHTARWVSQLTGEGWDIYLFPSQNGELHSAFHDVSVFAPWLRYPVQNVDNIRCIRWTGVSAFADRVLTMLVRKPSKLFWKWSLIWIIRLLKPDVVQSLEIQHAGYFTLTVRKYFLNDFPKWVVTNWGSDIYLFGRFPEHGEKIESILEQCDYYSAECNRDMELARKKGFKGKALPVFPNAGGFDLGHLKKLREPGKVSDRRVILLKGYQNWAGRALVGIRALAICADVLKGYRVAIYSFGLEVEDLCTVI